MNRKKIVIVENNLDDQEVIKSRLSPHFDIVDCYTQLEPLLHAIANSEIDPPDLLLLDLGLDRTWGYATFEKARTIGRKCPIIVLTGLDDEKVGEKAMLNGALDYLKKDQLSSNAIVHRIQSSFAKLDILES